MVLSVVVGPIGFAAAATTGPAGGGATAYVGTQATGETLYRVNAGGDTVSAASGPDWSGDYGQYVSGSSLTYSTGDAVSPDDSVPSGTPAEVFQTELYGDQQWTFSDNIQSGQQYEVRLYFAEIYATAEGDRVFDVSVEGEQRLDDYDIYADVGHDTGVTRSYTVTPTDGTIDVDLTTEVDNAKISAIEIVAAEPQPNTLGGPSSVDFGQVVTDGSEEETVTVTNLGESGDADVTIDGVSVSGDGAFSAGSASQTTLAPGESADIPVTFSPSSADSASGTLEVSHSGSNSPLTVSLSGEGASAVDPSFTKSKLQGFSAGNPTAIDFGPDGRAYVSTQGGTVYALDVERTGDDSYEVVNEVEIDAITDIPNHDDFGNLEPGEDNRQITGLTAGGTAENPVVYVSSSDPEIDVGQDDDDTDTNSGAISRLTMSPGSDGTLQQSEIDHDVMVLGLPRSEENHATNGLDLSADGDTLYVAQGGHTNKGAPGDNFGHTPEYALSAAILEIDLAQIENNHQAKNLQNYDGDYPNLDFYYAIPTIQNDDSTDGDDLPFGGNDGINQAKLIEGGPVQIYSAGYRNPYDLVVTESGQIYAADHGPNGGWGGQPADVNGDITADASSVTNHPNEDGSFSKSDEFVKVDEGDYGGHAAPIRANPTQADIYDANGNVEFDITESNSPVPESMVNPAEADYIPPTPGSPDLGADAGSANTMENQNGNKVLFSPTGGTTEYTASNFGGAMQGDILQVELGGDVERIQLSSDGSTVTDIETIGNTGGPLGITAQDDGEVFAGTFWTANHGGNDITVFEPVDGISQCTGADDASLDGDGDGYDNADEIDAGTDPCSAGSTPADFDDDGTSNLNDPDDDNDGLDDTEDPFAVDPNNGVDTTLPVQHDLSELSLFGEDGQGWTGLMTNGENYQDLYDTSQMTIGGAAEVLTVEQVPEGDSHADTNTQQYGFQFGVDTPDEPFTVSTTVESFPENPDDYQSAGLFIGTGDQSNYVKLVAAADGGNGGVQFAKEVDDQFNSQPTVSDSAVAGGTTTFRLTVDPTTDPAPDNGVDEVAVTAEYEIDGTTTEVGTVAMPASWLDTSDGVAPAVGVISTSNGANPFPATWSQFSVEYVTPPENQPPTADAGSDQTVDESTQVTLDASGSDDPDGDQLGYTWTQTAGPDAGLSQSDGETTTFTAPEVDSETTLTFQVSVSDGDASATDTVNVVVQDTDDGTPTEGEVVYRVNAGGSEVAATDGGPAWSADTNNNPSPYVNVDGDNGLTTYDTSDTITLDDSVPSGTPSSLFQTERFDVDASGSTADDTEMQWSFDAEQGATYEVRLYFAEIFLTESSVDDQGPRVFDVNVEGGTVLNDYNIYQQYGHDVGAMESFEVTPSDGTIDVEFLHEQENPKVSAIEIVKVSDAGGDTTVAEAVASHGDGDDSTIQLGEIQWAIGLWSSGDEVPDTGGETISLTELQQLVSLWSSGETVGDGNQVPSTAFSVSPQSPAAGEEVTFDASGSSDSDGSIASYAWDFGDGETASGESVSHTFDAAGDYTVELTVTDDEGATATATQTVTVGESGATGSALVEITPDSGNIDQSTYGGGTYQVTNTGDKEITSVSFNLDTATLPDMVFDPQGTAGDPTGEGLNIASEGGTGIVTEPGTGEAFSQPHNGQNADDGYDVMTVEFDDFQNGETATFWADNDPTSIKGATIGSQEAGPVSGLELARSTVTVTYADGTTQTTQLMGDGSDGGATAVVTADEAPAPTIGAQGVSLDSNALDDYHSAATVSSADQTITVTGQPGETVTLVRVEGELTLTNVPDADGDGQPGYQLEDYEANNAEVVEYYTATLDSNGEATVPVTLTNTNSDGDDNAGYNYFVAAQGQASGDMGLASNAVVLEYDESAGDQPVYAVNAGGSAYTAADGTEYVADANFAGSFSGAGTSSTNLDIAGTENDPLYQTERYGDPLTYSMPVDDGTYEVTLEFAEIYHTSQTGGAGDNGGAAGEVGDRVFDVSIEGDQVLSDYDIYDEVGGLTATEQTFTVEVTDGTLNIAMPASEDYAKLSAFTVESTSDDGGSGTTGSADIAVTPNGGIDASTYSSNTFQVENTGDKQISSVTFDVSESLVPDAVFDPDGTAGDATAKQLSIDSQSGDGVGVVSTADGDVFSQPHNGQNNEEGYDVMSIDFSDFELGESVGFSIDMDPTPIKGVSGAGGAGSVSGLEVVASSVTVEYADGSTQTTDLASDGSSGGAQATAKADVPAAPTLGVEGVSLQSTDFPGHQAATVDATGQTLTLSGPADATVQLTHVVGTPLESGAYDADDYEIDSADSVSTQTVTLGSNGEATVSVSLSESNLDYFVAAVEDDAGDTGETSNVVILDYEESTGSTAQVLHRVNAGGPEVAANDGGPAWSADTSSSPSQYLVAGGSIPGSTYSPGAFDDSVPDGTPTELFQKERYDDEPTPEMAWEFSEGVQSGGTYEVRLYFCDCYSGTSVVGDRVFDVNVEGGEQELQSFDIIEQYGDDTPAMESFTVTAGSDGDIDVEFLHGAAENPQISAIEIVESEESA